MPYAKVMSEFKRGKLHSGSKRGPVVKSRKQAVAIMLSEKRDAKKKGYALGGVVKKGGAILKAAAKTRAGRLAAKAFPPAMVVSNTQDAYDLIKYIVKQGGKGMTRKPGSATPAYASKRSLD